MSGIGRSSISSGWSWSTCSVASPRARASSRGRTVSCTSWAAAWAATTAAGVGVNHGLLQPLRLSEPAGGPADVENRCAFHGLESEPRLVVGAHLDQQLCAFRPRRWAYRDRPRPRRETRTWTHVGSRAWAFFRAVTTRAFLADGRPGGSARGVPAGSVRCFRELEADRAQFGACNGGIEAATARRGSRSAVRNADRSRDAGQRRRIRPPRRRRAASLRVLIADAARRGGCVRLLNDPRERDGRPRAGIDRRAVRDPVRRTVVDRDRVRLAVRDRWSGRDGVSPGAQHRLDRRQRCRDRACARRLVFHRGRW